MNKKTLYALLCLFTLTISTCQAQPTTSIVGAKNSSLCQMPDVINYTAADYIQDGIVSMWDGIENVGFGIHADNPQTWADLVGIDSIDKYGNSQSSVYSTWFNEHSLQSKPYFKSPKSNALYSALTNKNRTVEISFTKTGSGNTSGFDELMSGNWMNIAGFVGARLLIYHQGNGFYIDPPSSVVPYMMTVSLSVDDSICDVYVNGQHVMSKASGSMVAPSNGRLFFGMNLHLVDNISYFAIWTHSIRVYGKALTASEVLHNYKIDKARFK